MGFSRQEYWSGLPFPSLGDLPNPGIKPVSLVSLALAGGFFTTHVTWEAHICVLSPHFKTGRLISTLQMKKLRHRGLKEHAETKPHSNIYASLT